MILLPKVKYYVPWSNTLHLTPSTMMCCDESMLICTICVGDGFALDYQECCLWWIPFPLDAKNAFKHFHTLFNIDPHQKMLQQDCLDKGLKVLICRDKMWPLYELNYCRGNLQYCHVHVGDEHGQKMFCLTAFKNIIYHVPSSRH